MCLKIDQLDPPRFLTAPALQRKGTQNLIKNT